jgi:acyl-CoA thioesterase
MSKQHLLWLENCLKEVHKKTNLESFIGLEIVEVAEGKIVYRAKISDKHCNIYGFVHGGILSSIADIAMGISCMTLGKRVVTIDMSISYIKNVTQGSIITAVGEVIGNGRTIMRATGEILDERQQLLVKSQASYYVTGSFRKDDFPGLMPG